MIIWINGPFGVGKTTTANHLVEMIDKSTLFNPEIIGKTLWELTPTILHEEEFEDEPIWRSSTYHFIKECYLYYNRTLIIPMTISKEIGYNEIIKKLRTKDNIKIEMYTLIADEKEIERRLLKRGEKEDSWEQRQIKRCLKSLKQSKYKKHIDTSNLLPRQVSKKIFNDLEISRRENDC